MNSGNLIKVSVAAVLGVILLASLAIPLITEATATTSTFENDGYFKMTKYTTEEVTASYDATAPEVIEVNGETVALPDGLTLATSIIASDVSCLRYNADKTFQFFSGNSNTFAAAADNWTFTASEGTATFTNTTTSASRTAEYESIYTISNSGNWVMKNSTIPAYMNEESFFMGVGLTSGSSAIGIVGLNVSGSIEDGATIEAWRGTGLTFTDITLVKETVNSYIDLYALDKVTFTATDTESNTLAITYSYFIVPAEVTAEKSAHLDSSEITMLELVPLLLAVSLILGVIAYAIRARLN